ncbi:TetR/AcrR family transcriptional regulator [Motilibacter deserti]|uniref:TetR/AcrR family transcriptional regulator n=1 Tax=Motilibacter deserti TaxID=2714956 RepID=A0ABX0GT90_9ACTN|nr:TetR/AcrR family transcriptional regulator [Motilibacter deserti]NHC14097.1 TetR/AcrR family transcriptional regulator [Motilibacter deserti]
MTPNDTSREAELCRAALDLLVEVGYEAFSMDALAKRAHASKATIYRRWAGKPELIVEALAHEHRPEDLPDTGELRGDLLAFLLGFTRGDRAPEIFAAVAHAVRTDPRMCAAVQERLAEPHRRTSVQLVERAVARGELAPRALELGLFHDIGPSLVLSRLTAGQSVDEAFCAEVVDTVLLPVLRQS